MVKPTNTATDNDAQARLQKMDENKHAAAAHKTPTILLLVNKESPVKAKPNGKPKAKTGKNGRFFAFEMKDGSCMKIDGISAATSFEAEYGGIITSKRNWTTKKARNNFVEKRPAKQITADITQPVASSPAQDRANKLYNRLKTSHIAESNRIEAYFKTTSNSKWAVILWELKTQFGSDQNFWGWKPDWMTQNVREFAYDDNITDECFKHFLVTMNYGPASDPKNTDKTVPKIVTYVDRKKVTRNYEELVNYGYIEIPVDILKTKNEESAWLMENVQRMMEMLHKDVIATDVFEILCKSFTNRASFNNLIFDKKQRSNLPSYLDTCGVYCHPIEHLTQVVVQETANDIMNHLYQHRQSTPKFGEVSVVDASDIDEDEEDEE
jgi:hypothetical protein